MKFVTPEFKLEAFHCPFCGTYSHMKWNLLYQGEYGITFFHEASCAHCKESSLWRVTEYEFSPNSARDDRRAEMTYPDFGASALPEEDMPDDVKIDYIEASTIFNKSPRGAAALLRLALQKLCKHLGQRGENINTDIRNLAADNVIPPLVIKVADTVRITGNNAVHPGEMSEEDFDKVAIKLFDLINFIVKKGITEPKELEELYNLTPEGPRIAAEGRDAKSREHKT